jgi:hypothetical protein
MNLFEIKNALLYFDGDLPLKWVNVQWTGSTQPAFLDTAVCCSAVLQGIISVYGYIVEEI